jgi:aspartyl-tRNA(Asn)/glutamyl-tRNA(Gln) amidotransferase subunit A
MASYARPFNLFKAFEPPSLELKLKGDYYWEHMHSWQSNSIPFFSKASFWWEILYSSAFDNYFLQAKRIANLIQREFDETLIVPNIRDIHAQKDQTEPEQDQDLNLNLNCKKVHVLLHPSAIRTAPTLDEIGRDSEFSNAYEQDILTVPASLAGLPAISVPSGCGEDGWPLGISVVGQWGMDDVLLDVAESIEATLNLSW